MMGSDQDPEDGGAVAGAVFGAVFIYIVRSGFMYFKGAKFLTIQRDFSFSVASRPFFTCAKAAAGL